MWMWQSVIKGFADCPSQRWILSGDNL